MLLLLWSLSIKSSGILVSGLAILWLTSLENNVSNLDTVKAVNSDNDRARTARIEQGRFDAGATRPEDCLM